MCKSVCSVFRSILLYSVVRVMVLTAAPSLVYDRDEWRTAPFTSSRIPIQIPRRLASFTLLSLETFLVSGASSSSRLTGGLSVSKGYFTRSVPFRHSFRIMNRLILLTSYLFL